VVALRKDVRKQRKNRLKGLRLPHPVEEASAADTAVAGDIPAGTAVAAAF
jgi:hypothetical protein